MYLKSFENKLPVGSDDSLSGLMNILGFLEETPERELVITANEARRIRDDVFKNHREIHKKLHLKDRNVL